MAYRIYNTTKKPKGTGRNRNGYSIQVGDRTIYNGSNATVTDEIWVFIEKKMAELAAIGDVRIEIVGSAKTDENLKNLNDLVSEERVRAQGRAAEAALVTPQAGKVSQTGYEGKQAGSYDPNQEEDDLPFADSNHTDSDDVPTNDNCTVVAKSPDSIGRKQRRSRED
jgi:hypothetical protein